jgi:hypothetical protein
MGAGVAASDHVLVLPNVCARRAYVAKEEGMLTSALSPIGERACSNTAWLSGEERQG